MKRSHTRLRGLRRGCGWLLGLYVLYLIKSALGINLLANYSAPRVFKWPIRPVLDARSGASGYHRVSYPRSHALSVVTRNLLTP